MNTIYGQCVQPGIAIGRVRRWGKRSPAAERREIADTDAELARLRDAAERAAAPFTVTRPCRTSSLTSRRDHRPVEAMILSSRCISNLAHSFVLYLIIFFAQNE